MLGGNIFIRNEIDHHHSIGMICFACVLICWPLHMIHLHWHDEVSDPKKQMNWWFVIAKFCGCSKLSSWLGADFEQFCGMKSEKIIFTDDRCWWWSWFRADIFWPAILEKANRLIMCADDPADMMMVTIFFSCLFLRPLGTGFLVFQNVATSSSIFDDMKCSKDLDWKTISPQLRSR